MALDREQTWAALQNYAHENDRSSGFPTKSWVPPILGPLVDAAQATVLGRLYPFTSMNRLCFATRSEQHMDASSIAPAFVVVAPPGEYVVFEGDPYADAPRESLTTTDPSEAAAQAAKLLTGWPSQ